MVLVSKTFTDFESNSFAFEMTLFDPQKVAQNVKSLFPVCGDCKIAKLIFRDRLRR